MDYDALINVEASEKQAQMEQACKRFKLLQEAKESFLKDVIHWLPYEENDALASAYGRIASAMDEVLVKEARYLVDLAGRLEQMEV